MLGDTLNAVRWGGKRNRGFYEVWYITLVDPASGDSYWFRYTLEAPTAPSAPITLGLWGFSSQASDPKAGLQLHDVHPVAKFANKSTEEKGFRIDVGPGFLERTRAKGKVGAGDRSLEWDLTWEAKGAALEHVSPALEAAGIAQSSVNSANLAVAMSGTIKVGGKSVKVDKWPGEQSHTWGRRHADAWAWAHCNAFAEEPGAVFEGVSARVKKLGVWLPAATPLYVRLPGTPEPEEHAWTGVATIWSNRSKFALGRWEFEAESTDLLVRGTATVAPERAILVEYEEPTGEHLYDHCATGADLSLELYRRVGARWSLDRKLTSKGTTAFEYGSRERDPRPTRHLLLSQARIVDDAPKTAAVS
jgi:hypothetical protein